VILTVGLASQQGGQAREDAPPRGARVAASSAVGPDNLW